MERLPDLQVKTVVDLGAGPATSFDALVQSFPSLETLHYFEEQSAMVNVGKQILSSQEASLVQWHLGDAASQNLVSADILLSSYMINELSQEELKRLWQRINQVSFEVLIFITPGTPLAFTNLLQLRQDALDSGYTILAPCMATDCCPLAGKNWCHFSKRVARSSLLRQMKGGELAYEDEKFSYLIISRSEAISAGLNPAEGAWKRVLRHPKILKNQRVFQVCDGHDTQTISLTKGKDKEAYKASKKLNWGDLILDPAEK